MLYGEYSPSLLYENYPYRKLLKSAIEWEGCTHYEVEFGSFSGGLFLDHRLPYTVEDYLYIDVSNDILVLTCGCIYNQEELCSFLDITLPDVITNPYLIAQLYLKKGSKFVNDLNGDFSIVICQPGQKRLLLFRDHVGITPLAYTTKGDSLFFSSDIISLCRTFSDGERINMDPFINDYKVVDMTLTPNKKVKKLLPGHFLKFKSTSLNIIKYWEPERIKTDNSLTREQMLSELKSLLENSVHIRSDRRFKAGAHLSGGLDSSTVAVLARKNFYHQSEFYGYSWSPDNAIPEKNELDERELVKKTASMADIIPAFIHVEVTDFIKLTKNALNNFHYLYEDKVLEMANSHKVNLMFNGYGGDEFISFGSLGLDSDLIFNFQWKTFFRRNPLSNPLVIIKRLLYRVLFPAINFIPFSVMKSFDESMYFFKKEYKNLHKETLKKYYCYKSRRDYHLRLLYTYHISERTECWALSGYRNGVEYRYPLLDKRIIEYMLKVPSKILIRNSTHTRIILREITEGLLPEEVRWRLGKRDPAFFSLVKQKNRERALLFMDEVEEFKSNPDLEFINFSLLDREINKFKKNNDMKNSYKLCGDIVAFKLFHETTKSYHEPIKYKQSIKFI